MGLSLTAPSFVIPAGETSPEALERKRKMAEALLAQAGDTSPIGHWSQGAARMVQALMGGIGMGRANSQESEARSAATKQFMEAVQGGGQEALMGAMGNQFQNPGQQRILEALFSDQLKRQRPDWKMFEGAGGDQMRFNQNDPNSRPELFYDAPDEPKPPISGEQSWIDPNTFKPLYTPPPKPEEPPTSVQEYKYGQQDPAFLKYQEDLKKAGATNVDVNTKGLSAEEEASGKLRGERMDKLESGESIKGLKQIQLASKLLESVDTNALAGMKGKAGNIMVALGLPVTSLGTLGIDPEIVTTGPEIQSLVNRGVMSMIGSGQFPAQNFSDTDRMFLEKIFPSLSNLPEANKLIGMTVERLAKVETDKRAAWAVARKQGATFRDFEIAWNDQLQAQDIFGDIAAAAQQGGQPAGGGANPELEDALRKYGG